MYWCICCVELQWPGSCFPTSTVSLSKVTPNERDTTDTQTLIFLVNSCLLGSLARGIFPSAWKKVTRSHSHPVVELLLRQTPRDCTWIRISLDWILLEVKSSVVEIWKSLCLSAHRAAAVFQAVPLVWSRTWPIFLVLRDYFCSHSLWMTKFLKMKDWV